MARCSVFINAYVCVDLCVFGMQKLEVLPNFDQFLLSGKMCLFSLVSLFFGSVWPHLARAGGGSWFLSALCFYLQMLGTFGARDRTRPALAL